MATYVHAGYRDEPRNSGGMSMPGAGSMLSQLIGGGSGAGAGAGSAAGAGTGAGGSGAAAAGGSSGGGFSSALSAVGPWAALAAVIAGNEYTALKDDDRNRASGSEYWWDLARGEVLQQDMESWGIGEEGSNGFERDMMFGVQLSQADFGDAADTFKETTLGRLLRSIF